MDGATDEMYCMTVNYCTAVAWHHSEEHDGQAYPIESSQRIRCLKHIWCIEPCPVPANTPIGCLFRLFCWLFLWQAIRLNNNVWNRTWWTQKSTMSSKWWKHCHLEKTTKNANNKITAANFKKRDPWYTLNVLFTASCISIHVCQIIIPPFFSFQWQTNKQTNKQTNPMVLRKETTFDHWIPSLGSTSCAGAGGAWSSVAACHTWRWRRASKNAMPKGCTHHAM